MDWSSKSEASNALRSSRFCSEVGELLPSIFECDGEVLQIKFPEKGSKRLPGEWLLDAVVAKLDNGFVTEVQIALECESSTAKSEFARDFSKLLHVRARSKIYLQGLNQLTHRATEAFIEKRLSMAATVIAKVDPGTCWYFGFWPSPLKMGEVSLWDQLSAGRYPHLRNIRLFKLEGRSFVSVDDNRASEQRGQVHLIQ